MRSGRPRMRCAWCACRHPARRGSLALPPVLISTLLSRVLRAYGSGAVAVKWGYGASGGSDRTGVPSVIGGSTRASGLLPLRPVT